MAYVELTVESRTESGSVMVNRLRRSGYIPAVVYSGGSEAQSIMVEAHSFVLLGKRHAHTQLFKFKSSNAALDGKLALVKDVQTEPLKDKVLHVDFMGVEEGHRITVEVPLELVGECAAVKEGRVLLNQTTYELELDCLPGEIPTAVKVDISSLHEGITIHASDLQLPEGVVLKSSPTLAIVSTVSPKAEEAAAAAPAEGAAAPAAEKKEATKGE